MTQSDEYKQLLAGLIERFQAAGFTITHANSHPDFPQPTWVEQTGDWSLPDVVAEDRTRGLIIIGGVVTADSWNTEEVDKKLKILERSAHETYVIVPDSLLPSAYARERREHWRKVHYLSPSSGEKIALS